MTSDCENEHEEPRNAERARRTVKEREGHSNSEREQKGPKKSVTE